MRRSPQEKKALSYVKDRRNSYGENDKSSRKSIRNGKRRAVRTNRRLAQQSLQAATGPADLDLAEDAELRARARAPRRFDKCSDRPLGEMLEFRLTHRAKLGMADESWVETRVDRIRSRLVGRRLDADRAW
jgi:hypothetical protein